MINRHRGALLFAEATEARLGGDDAQAIKLYKKMLTLRPDFAPATAALAKIESAAGNTKRASKLIEAAWAAAPHPSLARVFKELDAAESATDWLKRVRALTTAKPDHPQSLLMLVDALMDAREYDTAKPVLDRLIKAAPTRAAWQYRLALAHALGEDPDPIEAALANAGDGARWHCDSCGHTPHAWSPLCPACGSFDSIDWHQEADTGSQRRVFDTGQTISLLDARSDDTMPRGRDTHT